MFQWLEILGGIQLICNIKKTFIYTFSQESASHLQRIIHTIIKCWLKKDGMTYPLFVFACFKLNRYWSENSQVIFVVVYVKMANLKYCIFSLVPTNRKKTRQVSDSNVSYKK